MLKHFQHTRRGAALLSVLAPFLFFIFSCADDADQVRFATLKEGCWSQADTISFHLAPVNRTGLYQLTFLLRTSSAYIYPYRQLDVEVCQQWLPQCIDKQDILHCVLSERDGEVIGRGVCLFAYEYPLDTLNLSQGDSCRISIRHLMRLSPLTGLYNVGIKLHEL